MHRPSITTTYLLPAIFLNPILLLHSLNTILSRLLPPIVVPSSTQPPPYSTLGPSANHPHLDIHASESLCWSYTVLIMCAQLMAFGRVSSWREEGKEKRRRKEQRVMSVGSQGLDGAGVCINGYGNQPKEAAKHLNGGGQHMNGGGQHMNGGGQHMNGDSRGSMNGHSRLETDAKGISNELKAYGEDSEHETYEMQDRGMDENDAAYEETDRSTDSEIIF